MVGTGRFELPTPRTPSECSTRLSHVPTRKESAQVAAEGVNTSILHYRGLADETVVDHSSTEQPGALAPAFDAPSLLQIAPVRADAHIHLQRYGQGVNFFHVLAYQRLHEFHFVFGNLEN